MKNLIIRVLLVVISIVVISCEPEVEPITTFCIKQGAHYASPRLVESMHSTKLIFESRFNKSAKYDLNDPAMQTNKNKLMGFADCNSVHHENSARFAWQWYRDQLEIYAYCYVNGKRHEKFVGTVELDEYNRYEIEIRDNSYIFRLNDGEAVEMQRGSVCNTGVYYMLWPYFGGSLPAPHTVKIDIKMIY